MTHGLWHEYIYKSYIKLGLDTYTNHNNNDRESVSTSLFKSPNPLEGIGVSTIDSFVILILFFWDHQKEVLNVGIGGTTYLLILQVFESNLLSPSIFCRTYHTGVRSF